MRYTPVLATLGYVLSEDGQRVLMVHRDRKVGDQHIGLYNGLGGKLERDEDVVAGMRREIREESGIECDELQLRGTISWPGFGNDGADWFAFIFVVTRWHGEILSECPEARLEWVDREKLAELPMWEGDRHFLPLVFDLGGKQFHGVMPYLDRKPLSWSYTFLGERPA